MHLDLAPRRAAGASHVDSSHTGFDQPARNLAADAPTHLLDNHRAPQPGADLLDLAQQPAPVHVAFRLYGLLQRVQMQDQRIGVNHVDGATALVYGITIVELHGSQVGKQQEIGRHITHAKRGACFLAFDAGTLAADTHGQALLLGCLGQVAVNQPRLFGAASHRADQDGRIKLFTKYGDTGADFVQIQLRQSLVDKMVLFQPGREMGELDVFLQVDADVISFTLVDRQKVLGFVMFVLAQAFLLRYSIPKTAAHLCHLTCRPETEIAYV